MEKSEQKDLVRQRYGAIATSGGNSGCCVPATSCCGPPEVPSAGDMARRMGYRGEELAAVPEGANLGLGCGNPQGLAELKAGETVVDLKPLPPELAADPASLCGYIAGAARPVEIERWLREAGFEQVLVDLKPESRELIKDWAPGKGVEDHVVSAMITGRKPARNCCG